MMEFIKYIFWLFFSTKGRISRKIFNYTSVFLLLPGVALFYITILRGDVFSASFLILYILFLTVSGIFLKIKRAHDLGLSWISNFTAGYRD